MSNITRRAILRGSASAIVARAVSAVPALAAELPGASPHPSAVAELLAEWHAVRLELGVYSLCLDEISAKMPLELQYGKGTSYPAPLDMPADIRQRHHEWMEANYPNDADDRIGGYSDALVGLERTIASTPATSIADVADKLRLQATTNDVIDQGGISDEEAYSDDGDVENHLLLSALRDAERLAGKGGAA
jgi:hypothetical protein